MFRLCLAVLACVVGAAACGSDADPPGQVTGSPSAKAPSGAPSQPSAASCPSPKEFTGAMAAKGWGDFRVTAPIVCAGGWATTTAELTKQTADPAHAVLRQANGHWRAVTYGTDGLCGAPGMHGAPAAIKKALGVYC